MAKAIPHGVRTPVKAEKNLSSKAARAAGKPRSAPFRRKTADNGGRAAEYYKALLSLLQGRICLLFVYNAAACRFPVPFPVFARIIFNKGFFYTVNGSGNTDQGKEVLDA